MYVVRADFRGKNVSKLNLFVVAIGLILFNKFLTSSVQVQIPRFLPFKIEYLLFAISVGLSTLAS